MGTTATRWRLRATTAPASGYAADPARRVAAAAVTLPVVAGVVAALSVLGRVPDTVRDTTRALRVFALPAPPPPPPPAPPPLPHARRPARAPTPGRTGGTPLASLRSPDRSTAIVPHRDVPSGMASVPVDITGDGTGIGGTGLGNGGGDRPLDAAADIPTLWMATPNWIRFPSNEQLLAVDPDRAKRERVTGRVLIACRITLANRTRGCFVLRERPAGYGFGAGALAAARDFRIRPARIDGVAVDGVMVAIPVTFING